MKTNELYHAIRTTIETLEGGRCSGYAAHEALGYLRATAAAYDAGRTVDGEALPVERLDQRAELLLTNLLTEQEVC